MATAKAQKDFTELVVEPFSDPDPKPLAGLLPARALADADSKFVTVTVRGEAVVVHYKESSPPPDSALAAASHHRHAVIAGSTNSSDGLSTSGAPAGAVA